MKAEKTAASASVDAREIEHFSRMAEEWWDAKGKFKPLHDMAPARLAYIRDTLAAHFGGEGASPLAGLSAVDIGCGGGLVAEPTTRMGADVLGIDASSKNIQIAALHAEKMGLSTRYRHTTAETLADEGAQFDIVLALEIIEHVADIDSFIAACSALLKPDGMLIMSTLNRTVKSYLFAIVGAEYVLRWLPRGTHSWEKFLRPSELHAHLRRHNMQVVSQAGLVFAPISGKWSLSASDLDVNYMLAAVKK